MKSEYLKIALNNVLITCTKHKYQPCHVFLCNPFNTKSFQFFSGLSAILVRVDITLEWELNINLIWITAGATIRAAVIEHFSSTQDQISKLNSNVDQLKIDYNQMLCNDVIKRECNTKCALQLCGCNLSMCTDVFCFNARPQIPPCCKRCISVMRKAKSTSRQRTVMTNILE